LKIKKQPAGTRKGNFFSVEEYLKNKLQSTAIFHNFGSVCSKVKPIAKQQLGEFFDYLRGFVK
jgi:hypothetical protein